MDSDISKIRDDLEDMLKAESYETMVPVLKDLAKSKMTKEILQTTKIGVLINKLRKIEGNDEVAKLATDMLVTWKKLVVEKPTKTDKPETKEKTVVAPKEEEIKREQTPPSGIVSLTSHELFQSVKTGDSVRDKCIEMLVTALCTDTPELLGNPDELILSTAAAVERALFEEHGSTDPKYKAKFRSKYLNLKDKSNPQLRSILLQGIITASHFISMTPSEMASEERRSSNLALQEENLKNTKAAQDTSAETDQFKCGRCKQRKCKYYQLQTRSADEPMTTFVTCINCNNRWKFC